MVTVLLATFSLPRASGVAPPGLLDVVLSGRSYPSHRGVLDVRGWRDFSRFDPRPGRPHFSNFGPPAERRPGGGGGWGASLRRTGVL